MELITSSSNPRFRLWKSLADKKGRDSTGLFIAEGFHMAEEALSSPFTAEAVLIRNGVSLPFPVRDDVPSFCLPERLFNSLSDTKTPQGVAVVLRKQLLPCADGLLVALDGLQDPGNVGTILRTADAAGFKGAILSCDTADVFSPKVLRATMGSIFRLGISRPVSLADTLKELIFRGYAVISSQLDGDPFFSRDPLPNNVVLVIGNEGNGVSSDVRAAATHRLALPMRGGAESLNASVAAGIMMYDLARELLPSSSGNSSVPGPQHFVDDRSQKA